MPAQLTITSLSGVPLVKPGDDLAAIALAAYAASGLAPADGDVLVVAQKIVSKAEDGAVDVATVEPSERAIALAAEVEKDPRLVEVILSESRRIVRQRPNLLIAEPRGGRPERCGRILEAAEAGVAGALGAGPSLVQGQADEAAPIVLVRGRTWSAPDAPAAARVGPREQDHPR